MRNLGFSGSAVVNVITKSGTNQYHGSAFEYLRNQITDATPFFASSNTPFRRNQFGGSFGGPVKRNKLFFFGNYQSTLFRTSSAGFTTAPTPKMLQGDFSELYDPSQGKDAAGNTYGQIYDPFSRVIRNGAVVSADPFPGNIIPRSRWDAVGAKMNEQQIWGAANRPGLDDNLYYLLRQAQTTHTADGRIDYNHSDKSRGFFRYSILRAFNDNSSNINQFWQSGQANSDTISQNMQVTHLYTFSANKVNEMRLGANLAPRITTSANSMDKDYNNMLGIKNGNLGDSVTRGLVEMNVDALHTVGRSGLGRVHQRNCPPVQRCVYLDQEPPQRETRRDCDAHPNTSADTIGGDSPRGTVSLQFFNDVVLGGRQTLRVPVGAFSARPLTPAARDSSPAIHTRRIGRMLSSCRMTGRCCQPHPQSRSPLRVLHAARRKVQPSGELHRQQTHRRDRQGPKPRHQSRLQRVEPAHRRGLDAGQGQDEHSRRLWPLVLAGYWSGR